MIRPGEKGRTTEDTEDTDKRKETRTSVQGWTAGNVITSMGNSQKGAPRDKEMLGRSAFVGGIAPGTSSGMLQSHLQRFAQVKYCALLSGTANDQVRAAKVTFVTREDRIKAMAADDSVLGGRALRVRTWACRSKAKPDNEERKGTPPRVESEQVHAILAPPGLENYTSSTEEEREPEGGGAIDKMATKRILEDSHNWEHALKSNGELCAVVHAAQGEEEPGKEEKEEGEKQAQGKKKEEPKGSARHRENEEEEGKTKGKAKRTSK